MKKLKISALLLISFLAFKAVAQEKISNVQHAKTQLNYAFDEIAKVKAVNPKVVSPRTLRNDSLVMVSSKDWTSGFFAGNLWYMYELTNDKKWFEKAKEFTALQEPEKTNGTTHDMGFKMYCSYGNGYRLTKDPRYKDILIQSARTLITRFNPTIGCIRSWDHHADVWKFPVIIDNMMNLELLFWAFKETKDSSFYKVAISHANTTMKIILEMTLAHIMSSATIPKQEKQSKKIRIRVITMLHLGQGGNLGDCTVIPCAIEKRVKKNTLTKQRKLPILS